MKLANNELAVDIKEEEIESAHRVGLVQSRNSTGNMLSLNGNLKPRAVIVK